MSGKRCTDEFKVAAVKQVIDRRYPKAEFAKRLGVGNHSFYAWTKRYGQTFRLHRDALQAETSSWIE